MGTLKTFSGLREPLLKLKVCTVFGIAANLSLSLFCFYTRLLLNPIFSIALLSIAIFGLLDYNIKVL